MIEDQAIYAQSSYMMADRPPVSLDDLKACLARVASDPHEQLDARLLQKFQYQLTDANLPPLIPSILPEALSLLPTLQQDPEPLVALILRIIHPLSFTDALSYTSGSSSLAEAIRSPSKSINLLAIELLRKAADTPSHVAMIAGMKDVVAELIPAYLLTDIEVSAPVREILKSFLSTDFAGGISPGIDVDMAGTSDEQVPRPQGQGLMWRRLFEDKDIYANFFSLTSLKTFSPGSENIRKDQRTVAQVRLLGLLPTIAGLDFKVASRSHFPAVETSFGLKSGEGGLLDYAALHMVEAKEDLLLHMILVEFYTSLLKAVLPNQKSDSLNVSPPPAAQHSSAALDFLISRGIHARAMSYYLYPEFPQIESTDVRFLIVQSADYIATYASNYQEHILGAVAADNKTSLVSLILSRISKALLNSSSGRHFEPPSRDLHILASLPRVALLPQISDGGHNSEIVSPVFQIMPRSPHEDFLKTLAVLFHGPGKLVGHVSTAPHSLAAEGHSQNLREVSEAAASRALFILYFDRYPQFFEHLVATADTIALKERALAAIGVISAIISAQWAPLPESPPASSPLAKLPTEDRLRASLHPATKLYMPSTGLEAVLRSPAMSIVIPYLSSPAQTFSNLVGGRGDAESAAYKVAIAKYEVLKELHKSLKHYTGQGDDVKSIVADAVARGPWAVGGGVGTNVGTLEL